MSPEMWLSIVLAVFAGQALESYFYDWRRSDRCKCNCATCGERLW